MHIMYNLQMDRIFRHISAYELDILRVSSQNIAMIYRISIDEMKTQRTRELNEIYNI